MSAANYPESVSLGNKPQNQRFADETTPFIRNCWYVAAFSDEITRTPFARLIMDESIVFYRTQAGAVTALQNRCAHRSFPLDKGTLEGDNIVCGYHGISFSPDGRCAHVPSQGSAPNQVKITRYKLIERAPLVWIWMGRESDADESLIPDTRWLAQSGWVAAQGYFHIRANYVPLHENLLDLTHFSYLHAGNVGTPEYAAAPYSVDIEPHCVRIRRYLCGGPAPGIYAGPMGLIGKEVARESISEYLTPAFHVAHACVSDLDPAPGAQRDFHAEILHFLTPESAHRTHYFWAFARDFALADEGATAHIRAAALKAFQEDVDALEWIDDIKAHEKRAGFSEISLGSDKAGLGMRRMIAAQAAAEN